MSAVGVPAAATEVAIAEPDRRFYAFAIDRLIALAVIGVAAIAAWVVFFANDQPLPGAGVIVAAAVVVWFVGAVLTGAGGRTPGKALLGLRVVSDDQGVAGRPIGVGKALVRQGLLGVVTLPTLGIGAAMDAWVATMDNKGRRQGWHDRRAGSVVVDVRPPAVVEETEEAPAPRRIVNLTTMRLQHAEATPPPEPARPAAPAARTREDGTEATSARPGITPPVSRHAQPSAPATPAAPVAPEAPTQAGRARHAAPSRPDTPSQPPTVPTPVQPAAPPARPSHAAEPARPAQPAQPAQTPPAAAAQSQASTARWRVTFDTGESFVVDGLALVGRGPEPRQGEEVAHRVALSSSDMSLSKTHAQFQVVADGTLVVMDRGSTNGTTLIRQGAARSLGARRPTTLVHGDKVKFGDREMDVVREA